MEVFAAKSWFQVGGCRTAACPIPNGVLEVRWNLRCEYNKPDAAIEMAHEPRPTELPEFMSPLYGNSVPSSILVPRTKGSISLGKPATLISNGP